MERTYIGKIKHHLDTKVMVQGFVENFRNGSAMAFLVLKDITGKVQITIEKQDHPELLQLLEQITLDSVLTVIGVAKSSDYVKLNGVEIYPDSIKMESMAAALPIVRRRSPPLRKNRQ